MCMVETNALVWHVGMTPSSIDRPAPHVAQTFDERVTLLPGLGTLEAADPSVMSAWPENFVTGSAALQTSLGLSTCEPADHRKA